MHYNNKTLNINQLNDYIVALPLNRDKNQNCKSIT
jgi:hypothetical protein